MRFYRFLFSILFLHLTFILIAQPDEGFKIKLGTPGANEYGSHIYINEHNEIITASFSAQIQTRQNQCILRKIGADGKILWSTLYPVNDVTIFSVTPCPDGSFVMGGDKKDFSGKFVGGQSILIKIDSNGQPVWEKKYQFASMDYITQIFQLLDGYLFMAEGRIDTVESSKRSRLFLCKSNSEGDIVWKKEFITTPQAEGRIIVTPLKNGNFYCTYPGNTNDKKYQTRIFTITPNGDILDEVAIIEPGISSVFEQPDGSKVFFHNKKTKDSTGKNTNNAYISKIQADTLARMLELPGKHFSSYVELRNGYYYTPDVKENKLIIQRIKAENYNIEQAEVVLSQDVVFDGFGLMYNGFLLFSGMERIPPADTASSFRFGMVLKKEKIAQYFKE